MAHPKVIHPDLDYEEEEARGRERNRERRSEREIKRQTQLFGSARQPYQACKGPSWIGSGGLRPDATASGYLLSLVPAVLLRPFLLALGLRFLLSLPLLGEEAAHGPGPQVSQTLLLSAHSLRHLLDCDVNPARLCPAGLWTQPRGAAQTPAASVNREAQRSFSLSLFFFFFPLSVALTTSRSQ